MIIPSNDFFIANGNERAHALSMSKVNFIGADFILLGTNVLDAGPKKTTRFPANTAFFGQMASLIQGFRKMALSPWQKASSPTVQSLAAKIFLMPTSPVKAFRSQGFESLLQAIW
jgi:hypothetical protein